jgi:hypothetical protein
MKGHCSQTSGRQEGGERATHYQDIGISTASALRRAPEPVPAARMVEFNDLRDRAFAAFSVPAVTRASNP